MLKLIKVAVTGCIACGKSSVCQFFKEYGAHVVSADEIVHQLLNPDTTVGQKVIALVGSEIVVNHQIDRSKIAQKVFNHPSLLHSLEAILHPAVMMEIKREYMAAKASPSILFVAEIPLLFEAGYEHFFDYVITVDADEKICLKRFKKRGVLYDASELKRREERLLNKQEKINRADFVIYNNGSLSDMRESVLTITKTIRDVDDQPGKIPTPHH